MIVYKCTAENCRKTYRSPMRLSEKYPPTHEHASKKVHVMKEVEGG